MKKLLLASILLAGTTGFSQVENFEGTAGTALPAGWTQVTTATDGGFKTGTALNSTYFAIPAHTRYVVTNDDICNCDKANEKLISPAWTVSATGTSVVDFSYVLNAFYGETANFGISTDGGTTVTDLGVLAATSDTWVSTSYDVSAYANQTVNLVWTYHDNADWGSGLALDDIELRVLPSIDMEMTSLNIANTVAAGNVTISGSVTNVGADPVTSIDITWDNGAGPVSETFAVNLNTGQSYNFTHGTQMAVTVVGSPYTVDVCVVASNDADNTNDCETANIGVVSSIVDKYVLVEEKTGTWCQYCPYGSASMHNVGAAEPNMIGIAVHNGDPMSVASYDSGSDSWPDFTGYPYAASDRTIGEHAYYIQNLFDARKDLVPPASISFTTSEELTAGVITITPSVNMVTTLAGAEYRVGVALVEDPVAGSGNGWLQVNALSGGSSVPHGTEDWALLPNPTDVTAVFGGYEHVGRALGNNQINGDAGSLPATLTDGMSYEYTYTFNVDPTWNIENMHAVAFLVNNATNEVLNAGETTITAYSAGITEESFNVEMNVAPNPTTGITNVMISLAEAAEVSMEVLDVVGNVVYSAGTSNISAGDYSYNVDLSNESAGIYFAKVNVNGIVKTVKINVAK